MNENDNPIPFTEEQEKTPKKEATYMLDSYYMVPNPDGSEDTINNAKEKLNTLTISNSTSNG